MKNVAVLLKSFVVYSFLLFSVAQISAEEIKDNRVANFEVEARKLDNKVWIRLKSEMLSFIFR